VDFRRPTRYTIDAATGTLELEVAFLLTEGTLHFVLLLSLEDELAPFLRRGRGVGYMVQRRHPA
jgi:hypothetical protein